MKFGISWENTSNNDSMLSTGIKSLGSKYYNNAINGSDIVR